MIPFPLRAAGLALTPWAIFVTSANALYLKNQEELGYDLGLYGPMLAAAAALWVLGLCLRGRALVAYLLAGPLFLLYTALDHAAWSPRLDDAVAAGLTLGCIAAALLFPRLAQKRTAFQLSAVATLGVIVADTIVLARDLVVYDEAMDAAGLPDEIFTAPGKAEAPNVYHILVDAFQTDYFLAALTAQRRRAYAGFTLYENNFAIFKNTVFSTGSLFAGTEPGRIASREEYFRLAYTDALAFFAGIKKAGLTSFCFNCRRDLAVVDTASRPDHVLKRPVRLRATHRRDNTFFYSWAKSYLPHELAQHAQPPRSERDADTVNISTLTRPPLQAQAFRQLLAAEPRLASRGRYTYLHVLLPHGPIVLREDCTHSGDLSETRIEQQVECTLRLVDEFLALLKQLGRYDDSLIVVHADHGFGDFEAAKDNVRALVKELPSTPVAQMALARARALLLVKPIRAGAQPLRIVGEMTTLLDIPTTIYAALGVERPSHFTGRNLLELTPEQRLDAVHWYNEMDDYNQFVISREAVQHVGKKSPW